MDKDLIWVEQYVNGLHTTTVEPTIAPEEVVVVKKEVDLGKVSLDLSILQQRMDSVSIMKYYKDLKNDRLKTNANISYIQSEEELFNKMNEFNDNKPWPKLDNYSKKKKINQFIEKMLLNDTTLDRKIITDECFEMLLNKKISKKTIEFDSNNDISTLGKYSIVVSV